MRPRATLWPIARKSHEQNAPKSGSFSRRFSKNLCFLTRVLRRDVVCQTLSVREANRFKRFLTDRQAPESDRRTHSPQCAGESLRRRASKFQIRLSLGSAGTHFLQLDGA